jgi:CBS domain containing-hemolysin-like protein
LVEEIVGEIRDEHELQPDVVRENSFTWVVAGSVDIDRLARYFGSKPDNTEAATVAGLVSELAGRIPQKGEVIEGDGLRFEVLDATDRRVERVRIRQMQTPQELGATRDSEKAG